VIDGGKVDTKGKPNSHKFTITAHPAGERRRVTNRNWGGGDFGYGSYGGRTLYVLFCCCKGFSLKR